MVLVMGDFDGEAALRALADPRRRQMLELVWDRERSPSDLASRCRLSRPATSQHLKVLREAGLVNATDLDGGFAAWAAAGLPVTPARGE